jgi:hypothetical protein
MTTTPQDLLAAIARAITDGASADERRAGRHACIVLAGALGEPGAPMVPPGATRPRIDGGPFLDVAIAKMRAFLAEQAAAQPAPPATSSSSTAPTASTATTASKTTATPAISSPRPRQPPLRIPLVGGFASKR